MSLGIVFKGSEGMVLAADSRVTLYATHIIAGKDYLIPSTFDNATKLLKVNGHEYVGAVTYGAGAIGQKEPRTAHSFLSEFEVQLGKTRLSVEDFAKKLSAFFLDQWTKAGATGDDMQFLIGGYDNGAAYGRVFEVLIPSRPAPKEWFTGEFGMIWGGQKEFIERLYHGYDQRLLGLAQGELNLSDADRDKIAAKARELSVAVPFQFLPLQDCVDLSIFLIRMTIELQTFSVGIRGVGGEIDVATITKTEGFRPVQQKSIKGEQ